MGSVQKKITIAVSGASGFVGSLLVKELLDTTDFHIIALSRDQKKSEHPRLEWRKCDFFSLLELEIALEGVDCAYYLVHSMMPSANLEQGDFRDYDLLLSDNFAKACEYNHIKQVIYLGGIIPKGKNLSAHLASRLEVETNLSHKNFSLTAFRSSIIIGKDSSSFRIIINLIKNLPILVCPPWSQQKLTPISIEDVIKNLKLSILNPQSYHQILEIGGNQTLSYFDLIKQTAAIMQKKRIIFQIPFKLIKISRFWVSFFSRTRKELVYPLLDSVDYDMSLSKSRNKNAFLQNISLAESLHKSIKQEKNVKKPQKSSHNKNLVRSIQRLPYPKGHDTEWVAYEYMKWLPKFLFPFVLIHIHDEYIIFSLIHKKFKILILKYSHSRSSDFRQLFYIRGGLLALKNKKGRLEFREVLDKKYIISAIHEFKPRLPWHIYKYSQALIHIFVMWSFGRHLKKVGKK